MIIEKPVLSPDFTLEDIYKLREYNYYKAKDMAPQERMDCYNTCGLEVHRKIQERKLQKTIYTQKSYDLLGLLPVPRGACCICPRAPMNLENFFACGYNRFVELFEKGEVYII